MKEVTAIIFAAVLLFGSLAVSVGAYGGKYRLDGLDTEYYLMLETDDEAMKLGSLSAKYESNGNPATISSGKDTGGVSYGAYQFSSRYGVPLEFVKWCLTKDDSKEVGERLKAAYELDENTYGENFDSEWKAIAQESPEGFLFLQHSFTKARFYDVVVARLESEIEGFEVDNYTIALKNVIWSRAVQNGVNSRVINEAFNDLGGFDNQPEDVLIRAIYAQCSKLVDEPPYPNSIPIQRSSAEKYGIDVETVEGKYLYYHSLNSSDIQVSVYRRLAVREPAEALEMFVAAGGVLQPQEPAVPPQEDPTVPPEDPTEQPTQPDDGGVNDSPLIPIDPPKEEGTTGDEGSTAPEEPPTKPAGTNWFTTFLRSIMDLFEAFITMITNLFS